MTYEYERKQGGLGWSGKWTRPGTSGTGVQQGQSCQVPGVGTTGRIICGRRDEEQFLTNQTCRPVNWMGETNCQTFPSGQMGTYWCCPPNRPGTGATATTARQPVEQLPMSRQDIIEMQSYVNAQSGCSAGTVDGKWGPNTQRGVECVAERDGWASLTGRFPFLSTLMATPQGTIREPYVFDPGTGYAKPGDPGTTKTPEQAGVPRVQTSLQAGEQAPSDLQQPPSFFARMPWWGWMGIAGGVGLLAVLGVAIYQAGEEEEEEARWTGLDMVRAGL